MKNQVTSFGLWRCQNHVRVCSIRSTSMSQRDFESLRKCDLIPWSSVTDMFTRSYACMPPNDFCVCYGPLVKSNYYVGVGRWVLCQCYAANCYRSTNSMNYVSHILQFQYCAYKKMAWTLSGWPVSKVTGLGTAVLRFAELILLWNKLSSYVRISRCFKYCHCCT